MNYSESSENFVAFPKSSQFFQSPVRNLVNFFRVCWEFFGQIISGIWSNFWVQLDFYCYRELFRALVTLSNSGKNFITSAIFWNFEKIFWDIFSKFYLHLARPANSVSIPPVTLPVGLIFPMGQCSSLESEIFRNVTSFLVGRPKQYLVRFFQRRREFPASRV